MNGLRWLRIRCNLSTSELADQLGVTRQAVCSWESGKKAIPEKRKNQMAAFFGIDRTYFDEIDEEKRNELIQKAMYFYQKDGKEIYLYRPNKTPKSHDETVTYFQKDREKSLDEEYLLAKKRKQQTIQEIEEQIEDKKETDCLLTKISHLHRGCDVYEITSKLFKKMKKEKAFLKIPYFCELMNVWKAMLLAYELLDEKSLSEEKVEEHWGEDVDFILHLSDEIKNHWEKEKRESDYNLCRDFLILVKGYALIHNPTGDGGYIVSNNHNKYTKAQRETLYDYFMYRGDKFMAKQFINEDF